MTDELPFDPLMASYPAATMQPLRLLIVEDDSTVAQFVHESLSVLQEAFPRSVIEVVHTWMDASRIIYAEPPPTVILLDLSMPGSTREETLARVADMDERSAVVIITGHNRDEVQRLLGDSKVEILLKNPMLLSAGSIVRAILRALERKQSSDAQERFSKVRGIVEELKRLGYGTPETS